MLTSVMSWVTDSNRNAIIAIIMSALIGAQVATIVTINVVEDTSQPPVWMQKEKAKVDAMRQHNIDSLKTMVGR